LEKQTFDRVAVNVKKAEVTPTIQHETLGVQEDGEYCIRDADEETNSVIVGVPLNHLR
jgi:hypothetical protein